MKNFATFSSVKRYVSDYYLTFGNIKKINYLGHNNINSKNFLIIYKQEKFVLHNFFDDAKQYRINQMCKILKFCYDKKAKVPLPYMNKLKNYVDKKNNVYLTNFYSGNFYDGNILELKSLAIEIARLHKILKENPYNFNYTLDTKFKLINSNEINKIKKIVAKKEKNDAIDKIFDQNLNLLLNCIQESKENKSFINKLTQTKQLIHGDLYPKNVLFYKNKVISILDFEQLRQGNIMEDIAFASFRFSCASTNDPKKIKNQLKIFLRTYKLHNELYGIDLVKLSQLFQIEILGLISFILREKYFSHSELWNHDFNKFIKILKLLKKIEPL